ncbi:Zn(II)2Cys6 transcription factor [Aspergillus undulatus]|uniref:Zn(II)2Cys6 transcription factor n=1 Tax=Aspergillus undulatus TaxID=1810928 RepID=UPI003CCCD79D
MKSESKSKTRRTHRLGSCRTCRRRHVRCDTKRPACETCSALGLQCEGFTDEIQWSPDVSQKEGLVASFGIRRQLLTEQDRQSMTLGLSKDLVSGSVDASLDEIDARSIDLYCSPTGEARIGPFAVFQFPAQACTAQDATCAKGSSQTADIPKSTYNSDPLPAPLDPSVDELLQWADFLEFGNDVPFDFGSAFDLSIPPFGDPLLDCSPPSCPTFGGYGGVFQHLKNPHSEVSTASQSSSPADLLELGPELLSNFQHRVIPRITVSPLIKKSPWKVVNMPAALLALGALKMMVNDSVTHAQQAHLYAVLAFSAFDLATKSTDNYQSGSMDQWKHVAERSYEKAKFHVQMSLSEETEGPRNAKLKDQLMAVYVMVEFAIFTGEDRDARRYLVEAERLLRLRGVPKHSVSRKLRILINVYCWLRIASESTYVLDNYSLSSEYSDTSNQTQRSRNQSVRLDDFLHIENSEHDLNIDEPKNRRLDITDIHLQDSRYSSETLGRQVYGLPETWLSLLSQSTRLANVMKSVNTHNPNSTLNYATHRALEERAGRLENAIHLFRARSTGSDYPNERETTYHLVLQAFNSALLIFFYRRVRHVHPAMLQSEVENVVTALTGVLSAFGESHSLGLGMMWPLFVSGCEATNHGQRTVILDVLEKLKVDSGLAPLERAKVIFSEVWRRRDEHSAVNQRDRLPTWIDVCKEQNFWPIFC